MNQGSLAGKWALVQAPIKLAYTMLQLCLWCARIVALGLNESQNVTLSSSLLSSVQVASCRWSGLETRSRSSSEKFGKSFRDILHACEGLRGCDTYTQAFLQGHSICYSNFNADLRFRMRKVWRDGHCWHKPSRSSRKWSQTSDLSFLFCLSPPRPSSGVTHSCAEWGCPPDDATSLSDREVRRKCTGCTLTYLSMIWGIWAGPICERILSL